MRSVYARLFCVFVGLLFAGVALAQEGHPLVGTWYGDWGPTAAQRHPITVVLSWDGKNISGTINPGPEAVPIKVATLDPSKWAFHIEADAKDKSGNAVHIVADGILDDLGSYHRNVAGTWSEGATKGNFKITRN